MIETFEHRMGPHHGARVVARAWTDPGFKERLLADGTAAIAEDRDRPRWVRGWKE